MDANDVVSTMKAMFHMLMFCTSSEFDSEERDYHTSSLVYLVTISRELMVTRNIKD